MSLRAICPGPTWIAGLVLATCLGTALPSAGQTSADDKAAAEALFDRGLALMKEGAYEQACQQLESSQRIDPGIGTLLYLAECYENLGKTASAWATFREAASAADAAGQADRARVGSERAQRLAPRLLHLEITLEPEVAQVEGLEILRDGRPVPKGLWGTPVPVDPGEHTLEARAPGYEPFRTSVTFVEEGTTQTVRVPMLQRLSEAPGEPTDTSGPLTARASSSGVDDGGSDGSFQRTSGLVIAGLGVVGVGVGSYFGLRAISKNSQAEDSCSGSVCRDSRGLELTDQSLSAARISNVAFIAGGVALAGGLALYFTAPERQEVTRVEVLPTIGGAQVSWGRSF